VNRYRGPSIVECSAACLVIAVVVFLFVRGTAICPVDESQRAACMAVANRIAATTATTVTLIFALILLLGTLLRSFVKRR
jgi:F0F1-type ATP synthase membrane subunit a